MDNSNLSCEEVRLELARLQARVAELELEQTEDRRTVAELRNNQESLTLALEAAQIGTWSLDVRTGKNKHSPLHDLLSGLPEGQAEWNEAVALQNVLPEDRHLFEQHYAEALATGKYQVEFRVRWPDDTVHWLLSSGQLFYDAAKNPAQIAGIVMDITARKQAEEALRQSEERFRAVADLVPDLLWSNDRQGMTDWYNRRWTEYTGQSATAAQGFGWLEVIHPADREITLANFQQALDTGQPLRREHRMQGADGSYHWFLTQALPLMNEEGQVVQWFGAATDIHEQRLAREELAARVQERTIEMEEANILLEEERKQLRQLSTRLIQVQESERRYLALELHDEIGQYLTGLRFMLENLATLPEPEQATQFANAQALVEVLTLRVRELSLNLRPPVLDDLGLLPALVWHIQRFTNQTGIRVDFRHSGLKERLNIELETTVYRLVQEALTNVARHAATSEVMLQLLLDEQLVVIVQDEGKGFDLPEVLGRHSSNGLMGMRERVELVGGQFTLESEVGVGTTLIAEIPLGGAADGLTPPESARPAGDRPRPGEGSQAEGSKAEGSKVEKGNDDNTGR